MAGADDCFHTNARKALIRDEAHRDIRERQWMTQGDQVGRPLGRHGPRDSRDAGMRENALATIALGVAASIAMEPVTRAMR